MKILYTSPGVGFYDGRYLKLDASNDPVTGDLLLTPTADSTTVLQVTKADTTVVLNVDTTNARVGVGTATPQWEFDVGENIGFVSGATPQILLYPNDGGTIADASYIENSGGTTRFSFIARNEAETVWSTRMVILSDGKVGIGTDAPGEKLEVIGGAIRTNRQVIAANNYGFRIEDTGGTARIFAIIDDSDVQRIGVITAGLGDLQIHASGAENAMVIQAATGRVGINNASPNAMLDVVGNADIIQTIIKANATQTANISENQLSDTTVVSGFDERGILFSDGGIDGNSVFIGANAGNIGHTNSIWNVGVGASTLGKITTADFNVAVGKNTLFNLTEGNSNMAIGSQAGQNITLGRSNTAIGSNTLFGNQIGDNNVAIGNRALYANNTANSHANNTAVGSEAGYLITTGGSNIYIGYQAGYRQTTLSNLLIIDNQIRADVATELTNSILYGVMAATPASQTLRINAEITTLQDAHLLADSKKWYFGAGNDLSIYYDGLDANIKTDEVAPSDLLITTGAAKTLELRTSVYDDVRVPLSSIKRLGFSDPDWVQFQDDGAASTGVYALAFDNTTDEEVFFSVQLPHKWKHATDIHPHVHWAPSNTDTGDVTWKLEYTIANINGTFGNTATLSVTDAGDGTALKHQYADLGDIDMSSYTAATDVSIMLMCRLYRDVSDADDYNADAFLLEIDFHYEIDTMGSRQETQK